MKTMNSSGVTWSLPPKPPPTSGAMTRILDSDMPSTAASRKRRMCGFWVADHMVSCSPVGSTTTERGSMNAGMSRCWRNSRSMTMPSARAVAIASSTLPPVPAPSESNCQNADLLVPRSGCARTVSSAASRRSSAAGQLLVVDVHELGGVTGLGGGAGDDDGHDLTGEGHPVHGDRGVVGGDLVGGDGPGVGQAALLVLDVLAGQHHHDVRGAQRLGGLDGGDPRVRERAADHRDVQHPGELDVVGPPGAAGDQPLVLLAAPGVADLRRGLRPVLGDGHEALPSRVSAMTSWPEAVCTARMMFW